MAKANKSRYALLGMLALGPASGYQIKRLIEESTANFWQESFGQIYPMLKQLTGEGLATRHSEKQEGKPESNVYTLTAEGRAELLDWLAEPVEEGPERIELLLKLFFGELLPARTNSEHVRHFQEIQQGLLAKYQEIEQFLEQCFLEARDQELSVQELLVQEKRLKYSVMTVRFGILRTRSHLVWCEETLAVLEEIAASEG